MANGRVSGSVMLRPIRVGLLLRSNITSLNLGIEWATSTWGGAYSLLFDPTGEEGLLRVADGLGVDVLYPVDDDERDRQLAETPGYVWQGRGEWSPYAQPKEYMSARLLGPEWLLDRLPKGIEPFLPTWSDDDPLGGLFSVWLGKYGSDDFGRQLAAAVEQSGRVIEIALDAPVALPDGISPIRLTGQGIGYSGENGFHGFVVVDPTNPKHLRLAWNVRALGGDVFPWPLHDSDRLRELAQAWIEDRRSSGQLSRWRRGDGTPLPPHASVMLLEEGSTIPDDLAQILSDAGLNPFPEGYFVVPGWSGSHPFSTEFERSFSADLDAADWSFPVPLPEFVPALRRDPITRSMMVAAQVELFREQRLGSTRWAALPNVRGLARLLRGGALRSTMRRPVLGGRALALEVSSDECNIELVPAIEAIANLFEGSGWECSQSDPGRFATRLADIFGGPGTVVANQPAARAVLVATVRSPTGKTIGELLAAAKKHHGSWPTRLLVERSPDDYAREVVDFLLYRRLLQPYFVVRCPECTILMTMRPEDLTSAVTCSMCSAEFPLGFALGRSKSGQGWQYRLPQDIGEDRLLEALALLATASALSSEGVFAGSSLHQFGIELKTPRQHGKEREHECELDLFMVVHDRGEPEIIVGEIKNGGYLEETDLDNLLRVRDWFLGRGFNCYPLFATLREELRRGERDLLRSACEHAPRAHGNHILPLLPIVLVGSDLSTAPMEEAHPRSWKTAVGAYTNLSSQSCVRNLGLTSLEWIPTGLGGSWQCDWGD